MRSGRVAQLRLSASSDPTAIMCATAPARAPATAPASLSLIELRTPTRTASARANFQAARATALTVVLRRRSEEHTSELQSQSNLVCRLLLEKKKKNKFVTATSKCI